MSSTNQNQLDGHPLSGLEIDDLNFITELVLQSGSLKGLASSYGVSYPTIRSRLDRVIERLRASIEGKQTDELTELLAGLVERGELTGKRAREIKDVASRLTPAGHTATDMGDS